MTVNYFPFMFREIGSKTLITTDFGDPRFYDRGVVQRLYSNSLSEDEKIELSDQSVLVSEQEKWKWLSASLRARSRYRSHSDKLSYLIVIPTLRCNLDCSYCQVSRAPEGASGYDLTPDNLLRLKEFIVGNGSTGMKIEFQGGECTLRLDLVRDIIDSTDKVFEGVEYVLCTNLSEISPELRALAGNSRVSISTSLDGDVQAMQLNRTNNAVLASDTLSNIGEAIDLFGADRVSALPTITEQQISDPWSVVNSYLSLGFGGVFLRPVNYQGFARKSHAELSKASKAWNRFYGDALEIIREVNQKHYFEEFYIASLLRSIFTYEPLGYVDFQSPAKYGSRYVVVDYDGALYPTDESRMLSRMRHIDLSIGSLETGIDVDKLRPINEAAVHHVHQDCIHCVYKPFCGIDLVDDLSRYNRIDYMKHLSWFCNRQMFAFDFIFSRIADNDRDWLSLFGKWLTKGQPATMSPEMFS